MQTTYLVRQLHARQAIVRSAATANVLDASSTLSAAAMPRPSIIDDHHHEQQQQPIRAKPWPMNQNDPRQQQQNQYNGSNRPNSNEQRHQQQQQQQAAAKNSAREFQRDQLDTTFNDTRIAYKSKSLRDLMRNYFVLGLCSNGFLVKNNKQIMKLTRNVLGKRAFETMMRATFYGQFVAGEDEREIEPAIRHLASFGVKTILDYSAEEDVDEAEVCKEARQDVERNQNEAKYLSQAGTESPLRRYQPATEFADRRKYLPVARTYFYHGESQCEKNLEIFFKAIEAVANTTGNTGFAAIKLTALGRPRLLVKLSKIIDYMRQLEGPQQGRAESLSELLKRFESLEQSHINPLDEDEEEMLFNLMRRVNRIAAYASQVGGARCMIDAEQTYMQPAINMIAMELMRQYNRREAIIFNTYQCYLKNAYNQVRQDLATARRENFFFGAKLVRGAYMDQERARASELGYEDPINETFEATSNMYNQTLAYLMGEIERELKLASRSLASVEAAQHRLVNSDDDVDQQRKLQQQQQLALNNSRRISIMVATHNEDSARFALKEMERRGIEPGHRVICFGQLYGMCDHVSFMLGQSGYSIYKYTPYGPIEEVLPYLGRRAIENHGFLSKLQRERSLLAREIRDRLFKLRWFYKPIGGYKPA